MGRRRLRVLTISYEHPPIGGGGSRVVEGLCRELAGAGDEIDLVTTRFDRLPREEQAAGVNLHRIPCVRFRKHYCTMPEAATYVASAAARLGRLVDRRAPDLVHAHFIFPDGVLARRAARRAGVPYLITAHGSDVPGYNPNRLQLAHRLLAPLWRRVTNGAGAIVCPSEVLRELVLRHAPGARVVVIPNGFDPRRFEAVPKQRRILVVTRMVERKGVQFLIEALAPLELDWEVHVVGDGPYLPRLRALASGSRTPIRFWGWMENDSDELRELYETSSVFALPSEAENFPICLLEAMAARNAIITTRGTGCAEVVGPAGWLVNPRDPGSIREALVALTADDARREALGDAARRRLEENFSWPVVADRYRELYERVLDPPS